MKGENPLVQTSRSISHLTPLRKDGRFQDTILQTKRTSRRSKAHSETPQDPKITTLKLEPTQGIKTGLLLQDLENYLNQRDKELRTHLMQERTSREILIEGRPQTKKKRSTIQVDLQD